MSVIQPYKGTSEARLLAHLNASEGTTFRIPQELSFGEVSPAIGSPQYNTKVILLPTNSVSYVQQFLFYNRISIEVLKKNPVAERPPVILTAFPFFVHDQLPAINAALGLNLTAGEVVNERHATRQAKYPLKITGSSYAWLPDSQFFFDATLPA